MKINVPQNIITALGLLEKAGFEAYAVGGCVRDSLLCKTPYDWDVCTCAKPQETMAVFKDYRTIPTGIKHGTVTVIIDSPIEITTYRVDGEYLDNRRPEQVSFTAELKADVCRRDFTVNAMAANRAGEITDLCGGMEDLEKRLIRCVGQPQKRFDEDALRIIRALRFAATLGFEIEEETAAAIIQKKDLLNNIAVERITAEFSKLLMGNCGKILFNFGSVFDVFMPGVEITEKIAFQVESAPCELEIRLAVLLQNLNSGAVAQLLKNMRFSNGIIKSVQELAEYKDVLFVAEKPCVKRVMNKIGVEGAKRLALFREAIGLSQSDELIKMIEKIEGAQECYTLSRLAVRGCDLSEIGLADRQIGKALHALLECVMSNEVVNEKTALLSCAKSLKLG